MPPQIIDNLLQPRNLRNPTLRALEINQTLYHLLILQPRGEITATANGVSANAVSNLTEKCREFIELASQKSAELAIIPEYACPKAVINEIVESNLLPAEGNLWIISCESLTKSELNNIVARNTIEWLFEQDILNKPGNFLNAVFLFFKTRDNNGILKDVGLIQFKTSPSTDLLERDNMICGSNVYILRNNRGSVHLITYICSDVLLFNEAEFGPNIEYIHLPLLIVHVQLNSQPRHLDIQRHRKFFLEPRSDTKEIICLNWARQTRINASVIEFGGSALYTKSGQLDNSDQRVTNNHKQGLYYTFWETRYAHSYYFNNDETVYYFQNTKVSQLAAAPAAVNRTGPEVLEAYFWNSSQNRWNLVEPNDGLVDLCSQNNYLLPIMTGGTLNPVEKERIAVLSSGRIKKPKSKEWHNIQELGFFMIQDEEIIRRVTFVQDPDPDAVAHRIEIYGRLSTLINRILNDSVNFPRCIRDLFNNSQIGYILQQDGKYDYDYNTTFNQQVQRWQ